MNDIEKLVLISAIIAIVALYTAIFALAAKVIIPYVLPL